MIRLSKLLLENTENRVNLMKLEAIMEKLTPELSKAQDTKLSTLCTEVHELVESLNKLPYTIYNHSEWQVLQLSLMSKLMEVKSEAEKLIGTGIVNVVPFIKALDEIIVN